MTHKLADWQIAELLDDEPIEEVDEWLQGLLDEKIYGFVPHFEDMLWRECHYTLEQIAEVWEQQLIPNWIEHGVRVADQNAAYDFLDDVIAKQRSKGG